VKAAVPALAALLAGGCLPASDTSTFAVLDNGYPAPSGYVVYAAMWQAVRFTSPIPPGTSSDPQDTVPASANTAYVVLAPGWNPSSATAPSTFIVLESRQGFGVHVGDTVHIPVSDAAFAGNCAAGSTLAQSEADFITQTVFGDLGIFAGRRYDAATCATSGSDEAGAH
jgi:hypothetical protein